MEMKKFLFGMLVFILLGSTVWAAGQGEGSEAGGKKTVIKIANWYADSHPQNVSLRKFKEIVEAKTEGNIEVQIYPNCQLGHEDTFNESVKKGTVEMGVPGVMMCNEVPRIAIAEMPFLFEGWDHARSVFRGEIGEEIYDGLIEEAGIRPLAWTVNGFREISSNRKLETLDDFDGLRLRLPPLDYYVKMGDALGVNVVTNAFNELFTSMEQKVVDAQDNPYPTDRASKFNEVQSYILETRHMFSPNIWIINEEFFQSLPEEYQQIVLDAADEAAEFNWDLSQQKDDEDKKWLSENGVTITIPSKELKDEIIGLMESEVYGWYYEQYPGTEELARKIRAAAN